MKVVDEKALFMLTLLGVVASSSVVAKDTGTGPGTAKYVQTGNYDYHQRRLYSPLSEQPSSVAAREWTPPILQAANALNMNLDIPEKSTITRDQSLAQYGPWLTETGISPNTQQLVRAIQDAAVHGLNPDSYRLPSLLRIVDQLNSLEQDSTTDNRFDSSLFLVQATPLREELSAQLNAAFIDYARHLGQGVVDAQSVQHSLFRAAPKFDTEKLLDNLRRGEHSVNSALAHVTPAHDEYQRLTEKMRDLLTEHATGVERATVQMEDSMEDLKLRVDSHGELDSQIANDVLQIQRRLIATGELPLSAELATVWNEPLRRALRSFQKRHGIKETGVANQRTRAALNLTIEQKIEAVALSLERWRWMPRDLGETHVFVNVPEYRVVVRHGSETLLTMDAVVGSVENPTPTFSRNMSYMEVNPTWTVPESIANQEIIPLERDKPGYLESRGFGFYKFKGSELVKVSADKVTEADFNSELFPYVLRQRGGPKNALGRLKFMMPNPYAIYLHDTPHKEHFSLQDRAFSHGCIRLHEPEKLARVIMSLDGYSQWAIDSALTTHETTRIDLRQPIPTHLTYMTTWVDDQGVLHRRNDIYQHDESLLRALKSSNTLLSSMPQREDTTVASNDI